MKLYIMECVDDPETTENPFSPGVLGQREYFVKLETSDEGEAYNETIGSMTYRSIAKAWWNGYMCHALQDDLDDNNIYHYIKVKEPDLELGDAYADAEGLVWERIK